MLTSRTSLDGVIPAAKINAVGATTGSFHTTRFNHVAKNAPTRRPSLSALSNNAFVFMASEELNIYLIPFTGIGTSALAAQRMKIEKFTGFDIDGEYLKTARERLDIDAADSSQHFL
jgi:hypothetical protein